MLMAAAAQPAIPMILKPVLDESFVDQDPQSVAGLTVMLVLAFVVWGFANWARTAAFSVVSQRVLFDLRLAMLDKLLALPIGRPDRLSVPRLMSRITFDANRIAEAADRTLAVLITDVLAVIGLLAWMAWIDWQLTLLMVLAAPFVALTVRYFNRRLRRVSRLVQESMGQVNHLLREALDAEKAVRVFGGQDYERQRFAAAANAVRLRNFKLALAGAWPSAIVQVVVAIAIGAVITITAYRAAAGTFTVGSFVSFMAATMLLLRPIRQFATVIANLQQGLAAAESVFGLIDEAAEPDSGTREIERTTGRIELDSVTFRYRDDRPPALRNVSLVIEPGETLALVGPSGAGKSTLANLLPRFFDPLAGAVRLDGVDLRDFTLASLRRQIAIVSQEVVLFNDTVAANIAYGGLAGAPREAIRAAAEAAFVTDFLDELPDGLESVVGENGLDLSGGQRQRLALARAFLKNAPILVLDEATSALDAPTEQRVRTALARLREGRTTLVIAHRPSTIETADRVAVMQEGRLVATGTHADPAGVVPLVSKAPAVRVERRSRVTGIPCATGRTALSVRDRVHGRAANPVRPGARTTRRGGTVRPRWMPARRHLRTICGLVLFRGPRNHPVHERGPRTTP